MKRSMRALAYMFAVSLLVGCGRGEGSVDGLDASMDPSQIGDGGTADGSANRDGGTADGSANSDGGTADGSANSDGGTADGGHDESGVADGGHDDSGMADGGDGNSGMTDGGDDDGGTPDYPFALPLRTRGRFIVDAHGKRVKWASVNWYGASDVWRIVGGLNVAKIEDIVQMIKGMGFNSVRLPFASKLLGVTEPVNPDHVAANPDLIGLTPIEVYDRAVKELTDAGILVILNNHTTNFMWCCNWDSDGLWYTNDFTETQWVENWVQMVRRYKSNPMVVGADLRNEVRNSTDAPLGVPSWATTGADFRAAAERAGNAVLDENPDILIVVEGINFNAPTDRIHLQGVGRDPIRLNRPHRLVYAAHNYGYIGPNLTGTKYGEMDWDTYKAQMDKEWGYVALQENRSFTAPVWVSEFGNGEDHNPWWDNLMRYLREGDFDFAYWAINAGPKPSLEPGGGGDEGYGLSSSDWVTPDDDFRTRMIREILQPTVGPGVEPDWYDDPANHFEVLSFADWSTHANEPHVDWRNSAHKATCNNGWRVVGMSRGQRDLRVFAANALCTDWASGLGDGTRRTVGNGGGDSGAVNSHTNGRDWSPYNTKLECEADEVVVGLAQTSNAASWTVDGILCATSTHMPDYDCYEVPFRSGTNQKADVPGEWSPGHNKGQCALEDFVGGVALSGGTPHSLLCCTPK
jgi:endoglucanase